MVAARTYTFALFTTGTPVVVATPGSVLQFNLPLTASSTSNFGVVSNNVVAVAVDANGDLVVGNLAGALQLFTAPLSGASTPAASFANGAASNNGQIAFDASGDFWAAGVSNQVNRLHSRSSGSPSGSERRARRGAA